MEIRVKQLLFGLATIIIPPLAKSRIKIKSSKHSARYYYSVFLRHLVMLHKFGQIKEGKLPKSILELGPGASLGFGIMALICGVKKYTAFDVIEHVDNNKNIELFNELLILFKNKTPIPDDKEYIGVIPKLDDYSFPNYLFDNFDLLLAENRLNLIKKSIKRINKEKSMINYITSFEEYEKTPNKYFNAIFSQAVLEHVEDLNSVYNSMHKTLKSSGFMSHSIDYKSHGSAKSWNGHWSINKFIWTLQKGRRDFFINRFPYSQHIKLLKDNGFEVICSQKQKRKSKISKKKCAKEFDDILISDLEISESFIIANNG